MSDRVGMFSDSHRSITEYLAQLDTLKGAAHSVFSEMQKTLEEMDIPVAHIVAVNRSATVVLSSATKKLEPLLYLFIQNNETYLANEPRFNKTHKKNIRSVWIQLCKQHAVADDYASNDMELCLLNTQKLRLYMLALACKNEIIAQLAILDSPGPKYVFASTGGFLHIVYPTKSALEKIKNGGRMLECKRVIFKIMAGADRHNCFDEKHLSIEFLDAETDAAQLYGLSRED